MQVLTLLLGGLQIVLQGLLISRFHSHDFRASTNVGELIGRLAVRLEVFEFPGAFEDHPEVAIFHFGHETRFVELAGKDGAGKLVGALRHSPHGLLQPWLRVPRADQWPPGCRR